MKREDCKPNRVVMLKGVIDHDDKTTVRPIKVNFIRPDEDEPHYAWFDPDQLLEVKEPTISRTRKFCKGDKVRYVSSGRGNYLIPPVANGEYEVTSPETSDGWVYLTGMGYNNCVKWYDLELVESVGSVKEIIPFTVEQAEGPYFHLMRGEHRIMELGYGSTINSPYTKEDASQKVQELCDVLNRKHNPSNN